MNKNQEIGHRIKKERTEQGLKQQEMAKATRIDRSRLKRIEAGARIYHDEAHQIATILKKPSKWILDGPTLNTTTTEDQKAANLYKQLPRPLKNATIVIIKTLWQQWQETKK